MNRRNVIVAGNPRPGAPAPRRRGLSRSGPGQRRRRLTRPFDPCTRPACLGNEVLEPSRRLNAVVLRPDARELLLGRGTQKLGRNKACLAWGGPKTLIPRILNNPQVGSEPAEIRCPKELVIVPGATYLFEEPGALAEVARLAKDWFVRHLTADGHRPNV
jgi:hypothetical protein